MITTWRKSSFSSGSQDCVELADGDHRLLIRDSKHPDGGHLAVAAGGAASFLEAVKAGQFDRLA